MLNAPRLLHQYVILKPDEVVEETTGGFIIPKELQSKSSTGIVLLASKGWYAPETGVYIPIEVKSGDRVYYSPFAGEPVNVEGDNCLMIKQSDIKFII